MPGLVCYMFNETLESLKLEREVMSDYVLTLLRCYRNNPYHNAEHAFCFTHTMYLILVNNREYFNSNEVWKSIFKLIQCVEIFIFYLFCQIMYDSVFLEVQL